jgi:threonine dehydrogenase-like Zn-dependent dehydrogenase
MKAFYIDEPGKTCVRNIEAPKPAVGEVLLKVCIVGLCGSDLNTFRGLNPLVTYPKIPGHEIGATIEAVGEGTASESQLGAKVTVFPYTNCGICSACRHGRTNCCQNNQTLGVQRDGALTEYMTVPWVKIFASDDLTVEELALVELLSIGFHAVERGRLLRGVTVAILGCGTVGLGAVAGASFRKAKVIAIDIDDGKLAIAKKTGAKYIINSRTEPLHEKLQEITNGNGPEIIVEAIGLPLTYRQVVNEVAFAGRVVYIGYVKEPVTYETKLFVQKELDILGSRNATHDDFRVVMKMLENKIFPTDEVITLTSPLEKTGEALQAWSDNPQNYMKIQVAVER